MSKLQSYCCDILITLQYTNIYITVHLDGSLRVETLIELAEKEGLGFTRQTIEETFKDKYMNLEEYLGGFQYTVAVMQNAEVGK